jgi:hypothetical protein
LKENIFKINTHLKVEKLKTDLKKLYFNIVVNKKGNGSVHYVRADQLNPWFGMDIDYQEAYFNVHLPHQNVVIPPPYFRYLKSGFENIFHLSSDYIDERLKDAGS